MNRRTFLAAAATATATLAAPVPKPPPVYDLICVEILSGKREGYEHRIRRVPVAGNPTELGMVARRTDSVFYRLHSDRYVVSDAAQVFDLFTGTLIHDPAECFLQEPRDDRVFYRTRAGSQGNDLFAFDLTKQTVVQPASPNRWELPGIVSPDGTRSVSQKRVNGQLLLVLNQELIVHNVGGEPASLGNGFTYIAPLAASLDLSSLGVGTPVLWLDEDRILTQTENGKLLTVDVTTGKRDEEFLVPSRKGGGETPSLIRDAEGNIVYDGGDGLHRIDVKAGTSEQYEWHQLGHGFTMSVENDKERGRTFRHKGKEIGHGFCNPWALACPRQLVYRDRGQWIPDYCPGPSGEHRVWTADKWSKLKVSGDKLVGWVRA